MASERNARELVLSCIQALNREDFKVARQYLSDDLSFGVPSAPAEALTLTCSTRNSCGSGTTSPRHSPWPAPRPPFDTAVGTRGTARASIQFLAPPSEAPKVRFICG